MYFFQLKMLGQKKLSKERKLLSGKKATKLGQEAHK